MLDLDEKMKYLEHILLIMILLISSCVNDSAKITTDLVKHPLSANPDHITKMPHIQIAEDIFDFGDLQEGESVTHDFVIKNIGAESLIISSAKGSCGCTVPLWPKEPVLPGNEAKVQVTFNSVGKKGIQRKTVTLITNAIPNTKVLTIKGNIIVPNKE